MSDVCSWCGTAVPAGEGFRAQAHHGVATFCRLEHVVPWAIRGARWEHGGMPWETGTGSPGADREACAWCGDALGDASVRLVRERGEHRIADRFCSVGHLLEWAKAGGRYAV